MMFQCSTILLISLAPAVARVFHSKGKWHGANKMDTDMRPEVVSTLLQSVEAKWVQEAMDVMSNHTEESVALSAMESSCVKVSSAVVQGADGDRLRVVEYMKTVCKEPNARSNIAMCTEFANAIEEFMIGDNEYNREKLDMHDFCQKFWSTSVAATAKVSEQKAIEEEKQRLAAEQKREQDEAEEKKKIAQEAAVVAAYEAGEKKRLAEAAREAAEKRKLLDEVAKNNTALTVAARWNLAASKKTTSTNQPVNVMNTSTSANASTVTTANKTETLGNATTEENAGVSTQSKQTLQKNQTQAKMNFTLKAVVKNFTRVDTANNQSQPMMNSTLKVDNAKNQSQPMMNSVVNAVVENSSAVVTDQVQKQSRGNLTQRVRKQLRFVMNHTKNVTA